MAVRVDVQVESRGAPVPSAGALREWALVAVGERRESGELTVRVVDEPEGAELNRTWRHGRGATNVLSFPCEPPPRPAGEPGMEVPLGDVVICAPVVIREAGEQGKDPRAHFAHMVVHGVLHLLGHDHDDAASAACMESLERALLAALGFADPYEVAEPP